jgi:hypothetical protein
MKTITINTYSYNELNEQAKAKARDWFREASAGDNHWADSVEEDFRQLATMCGFSVKDVRWSGFWSQGDGASFTGAWSALAVNPKALKGYAPKDEGLHEIVGGLATVARDHREATATLSIRDHHYCHPNTIGFKLDDICDGHAIDDFKGWTRALMNWLYRTLEKQYEYENSDECVAENIQLNDYAFTAEGSRRVTL